MLPKALFSQLHDPEQQCGAVQSLITVGNFSGHRQGDFSSYTGSILDVWEWGINRQKQLMGWKAQCPLCGLLGGVQTFGSADDLESKSVTSLVIFLGYTDLILSANFFYNANFIINQKMNLIID